MTLPACVARIVQVPPFRRVILVAETVQTSGVVLDNSTGRFELAVAIRGTAVLLKARSGKGAKVMDCGAGAMVNVWVTGAAAE